MTTSTGIVFTQPPSDASGPGSDRCLAPRLSKRWGWLTEGRPAKRSVALLLVVALAQTACGGGLPAQPPILDPQSRVEDGGTIQLAVGDSVTVGGVGTLVMTFERVASDSRCPPDVQCVWQGEVTVQLRLSAVGTDTVALLSTVRGPSEVEYGGHVVALGEVTPSASKRGIDRRLYRVNFSVRASG